MNNLENSSISKSINNINNNSSIKKSKIKINDDYSYSYEKSEETKKKANKNSKKKRKKKKKLLKTIDSLVTNLNNNASFNVQKNPYRSFLIYKLRKKYDAKTNVYEIKKLNEIIFNIPSHFTAIFKEYLLKEEEAEFLKRIYNKNEMKKKLKNIFYFYEKYSKIFPNYIVIPEGHYLYRNILKKQKMIDKLQKIKEEEMKNKEMLLDGSFNTIFSNGAIDSIYSNLDTFNLANLIYLDNNEKNEEEENNQALNIIKTIEKYENLIENKNSESLAKKQTIYKKEFKNIRSLSRSTHFQNGQEIKGKKDIEKNNNNNIDDECEKNENENLCKKNKKKISNIKINTKNKNMIRKSVRISENAKMNTEIDSDEGEDAIKKSNNKDLNIKLGKNLISDYNKNSKEINNNSKILFNKANSIKENDHEKSNNNDDEIIIKNKKKKVILLKGSKHYFIKNKENNEKNEENNYSNYRNEDKKIINKSNNILQNKNHIYHSKNKIHKYTNSFTKNINLRKDDLTKNKHVLYRKKLINDNRGLSITKRKAEFDSTKKILHKVNTTYTINGSTIVPVRKYLVNEQRTIPRKKTENNEEDDDNDSENINGHDNEIDNDNDHEIFIDKKKRFLNNDTFINSSEQSNINLTYYKTITYSRSNYELNEPSKKTYSINGNVYYKKHKFDNLRGSHTDKSCPKKFNRFLDNLQDETKEKKEISNQNNSIEEKSNDQNSNDNIANRRYYRMNQYSNKKFKLRAPKNYYKI